MSLMVTRQERTGIARTNLPYSLFVRHGKYDCKSETIARSKTRVNDLGFEGVLRLNFPRAIRLRPGVRAEFDGDVHFGFDRLAVDQGLIKLPLPHVVHHPRHQRETAAHGFEVLDGSIFVNEGTHRHRISGPRVTYSLPLVCR